MAEEEASAGKNSKPWQTGSPRKRHRCAHFCSVSFAEINLDEDERALSLDDTLVASMVLQLHSN